MKSLISTVAALALSSVAAMADPVEGLWQTQADDGAYAIVQMAPCADQFCGTIARTFRAGAEYQSANIGRQLVWDMQAEGEGRYGGGKIWQPSTDKVFRSKMVLAGGRLTVSGCFGPICKKQTWTRVK